MFYLTTKKHEYPTKTWQQNDETYIFEVIIKKQTFLIKKNGKGAKQGHTCYWGVGGQNHNGFKLDLASEYGISRSQLAWIIASNNDYMIIKERATGYREK